MLHLIGVSLHEMCAELDVLLANPSHVLTYDVIDQVKLVEEQLGYGTLEECLGSACSLSWITEKERAFIEWTLNYYENLRNIKSQIASGSLNEADRHELAEKLNSASNKTSKENESDTESTKHLLAEKSKSIMLNQIKKMKNRFLKASFLNPSIDPDSKDEQNLMENDSQITNQ